MYIVNPIKNWCRQINVVQLLFLHDTNDSDANMKKYYLLDFYQFLS